MTKKEKYKNHTSCTEYPCNLSPRRAMLFENSNGVLVCPLCGKTYGKNKKYEINKKK